MAFSGCAQAMSWILALLLFAPQPSATSCNCGYTVSSHRNAEAWLFTESLEVDFTKLDYIQQDADWRPQDFRVSAYAGRGEYGKSFVPQNAVIHPELDAEGQLLNDNAVAGLDLIVSGGTVNDSILGAEVDSARLDLQYGSYRAGMRIPDVNGTCAAFFWYFNDTQEIDIEFLSREFDAEKGLYPVNLVIQSEESKEAGYDASNTGMYKVVNLTFDPTTDFHEYRFDYLPGQVFFYVDSELVADMHGVETPSAGGHLILQHWSNGNPQWSGGPTSQDASLRINYVKAYFNTSDPEHLERVMSRCTSMASDEESVCSVPDIVASDVGTRGEFFSISKGDDVVNDTDVAPDKSDEEAGSVRGISLGVWTWSWKAAAGFGTVVSIRALL